MSNTNKPKGFHADDAPPYQAFPKTELVISTVERNRWFVVSLMLTGVCMILTAFSWFAFSEAQTNTQVMFVKMKPDGAWENITYDASEPQLFFKTTVDHILANYIEKRFGVIPQTINADYGEVQVFLGDALLKDFLGEDRFNAPLRAQQAALDKTSRTDIKWTFNDHYDEVVDDNDDPSVVRTNIYFTRTVIKRGDKHLPEKLMLSIQWQLLTKAKLSHQDSEFIRYNPIGLQIISQRLTREATAQ